MGVYLRIGVQPVVSGAYVLLGSIVSDRLKMGCNRRKVLVVTFESRRCRAMKQFGSDRHVTLSCEPVRDSGCARSHHMLPERPSAPDAVLRLKDALRTRAWESFRRPSTRWFVS